MRSLCHAVEYFVATLIIMITSPFLAVLGQTIAYRGELVVDPEDLDIPQ